MKARRKSDGEIIEVEAAVYNMKSGEPYHKCISDGHHYPTSDLDFNLDADIVISGWVARASDGHLALFKRKPDREIYMRSNNGLWFGGSMTELDSSLFPDLTWDDDPIEVELIIKRKNNG